MVDTDISDSCDEVCETCAVDDLELLKSAKILLELPVGKTGIILKLSGGRTSCKRLNELGLVPGTSVEMVNKINNGPVMIKVKGSKLALGRGLASKVFVNI